MKFYSGKIDYAEKDVREDLDQILKTREEGFSNGYERNRPICGNVISECRLQSEEEGYDVTIRFYQLIEVGRMDFVEEAVGDTFSFKQNGDVNDAYKFIRKKLEYLENAED